MEFQKLIEERRTIRKYSPEGKITKDELLTIIRAAQEAPSWKKGRRSVPGRGPRDTYG